MKRLLSNYPPTTDALIAAFANLSTTGHVLSAINTPTDQGGHIIEIFANGGHLAMLKFEQDGQLAVASLALFGGTDLAEDALSAFNESGFDISNVDPAEAGELLVDLMTVGFTDETDDRACGATQVLDKILGEASGTTVPLGPLFAEMRGDAVVHLTGHSDVSATRSGVSSKFGALASLDTRVALPQTAPA